MAKTTKLTFDYKTKNINGRTHIQCQNCNPDSKYYTGTPCDNWVPLSSKDVVSILCGSCTSNMCRTPQTKKRVVKSAPAKRAPKSKTTATKSVAKPRGRKPKVA